MPLSDNNAVCNLCCRLGGEHERKAFLDGLQYGAHLMLELTKNKTQHHPDRMVLCAICVCGQKSRNDEYIL